MLNEQFRAPGKLVLRSERLRGELAALDQAAPELEANAVAANGAAKSAASKGRKRAAGKVAGSSADVTPGGTAKAARGKAGTAARAEVGADQRVSKKRRKEKDPDAGQLRGSAKARGNGHGEPQVLNRQQVQPEAPAHHGNGWGRSSGSDPPGGGKADQLRALHARQGSGSGSEAGLAAGSPPPSVRWDIDVAAALGIGTGCGGAALPGSRGGHPVAPLRGVSPSAATSGAWASTSFGGSLPPPAALPSRERGTASAHLQPMSRSLSAASGPGPGESGHPSSAPLQQGVPRLKIKLRVPPGSQSAGPPAGPASAGGSRRSSGSGGRSARALYDDSWFAEHVGRAPRLKFAIGDEAQVRTIMQWSLWAQTGSILSWAHDVCAASSWLRHDVTWCVVPSEGGWEVKRRLAVLTCELRVRHLYRCLHPKLHLSWHCRSARRRSRSTGTCTAPTSACTRRSRRIRPRCRA